MGEDGEEVTEYLGYNYLVIDANAIVQLCKESLFQTTILWQAWGPRFTRFLGVEELRISTSLYFAGTKVLCLCWPLTRSDERRKRSLKVMDFNPCVRCYEDRFASVGETGTGVSQLLAGRFVDELTTLHDKPFVGDEMSGLPYWTVVRDLNPETISRIVSLTAPSSTSWSERVLLWSYEVGTGN